MNCNLETKNAGKKTTSTLTISKFDVSTITEPFSLAIIGKRLSGKTTQIKNLLEHFSTTNAYDEYFIVSPVEESNKKYSDIVDNPIFIANKLNEQYFEKILRKQKSDTKNRILVILEDCITSKGMWNNSYIMRNFLLTHKNFRISLIITMQFPLNLTSININFDYISLCNDEIVSNIKRMYDFYAGIFPSFDAFRQIFSQIATNYSSLLIKNSETQNYFLQRIFWFETKLIVENFKIKLINLDTIDNIVNLPLNLDNIMDQIETDNIDTNNIDTNGDNIINFSDVDDDTLDENFDESNDKLNDKLNIKSIDFSNKLSKAVMKINQTKNTDPDKIQLLKQALGIIEKIIDKI